MGYYTYYTMEAKNTKTNAPLSEEMEAIVARRLWEISDNTIFEGDNLDACLSDSLKWYDHEEDLVALSREFPDIMFKLEGEGEDRDDMWCMYAQNGEWEVCEAKIVYEEPENPRFRKEFF